MTKRHHCQFVAFSLSLLALISMCLPYSAWATVAGRFQFVAGDVRIISADNKERPAIKGGEVHEKESILSGKTGSAQLRMVDDGIVAVRPDTALRIDEYRLASIDDGAERGFFSLLKGGFRSITGLIGKSNKDNYGIKTPSATIGIRGTDHETIHIATAQPNLPEGTYNKVNTGETVVNGTLIGPNQVGYAPNLNTPAAILPHSPTIFDAPKSGQQGKDDRKRDADKTDGKQQTKDEKQQGKDEKKQDAGQKPLNGNGQPPVNGQPAPAPGSPTEATGPIQPGAPMPMAPPPQNLMGNTALILSPPPSNPLPPPPITGGGAMPAPIGSGIVGGDISNYPNGMFSGSGGMVIEDANQTILFDPTTKLPVLIAQQGPNGGMQYTAGTAQMIDSGGISVGTAKVFWGRYVGAGDQFLDGKGARDPNTMNIMFTDQAMKFTDASAYLQTTLGGGSHTFTFAPGVGNIVDELGSKYTANSATSNLTVSGSAGIPLSLHIDASNGARTWALTYSGPLQNFYQSNCTAPPCGLALTSALLNTVNVLSASNGGANGIVIGPNAAGIMTVFTVNGAAAIGSLLGTALFLK